MWRQLKTTVKKRDANHWEKGDHSGARFDLCIVYGHIHQQTATVAKVELENIKVSLNEVKRDVKDLGNKIDRKSDKTDAKLIVRFTFLLGTSS